MFKSIGDVTKKIIEIETEEKLFDFKIDGIFVWELIRVKIYLAIIHHLFDKHDAPITNTSFINKTKNKLTKLFSTLSKLIYLIYHFPYSKQKNIDCLIFESSRKVEFNNKFIDPYTYFYVQELKELNKSIVQLQSSYKFDKLQKDNKNKSIELLNLLADFNSKKKEDLNIDSKKYINHLNEILVQEFGINLTVENLIIREIANFKSKKKIFTKLLNKYNPKQIYLVNFCDKAALIFTAKELKISVIDIQHGLISSDDLIYHYSKNMENKLNYFPDYFYSWNKIWKEICGIPLSIDKIRIIGNRYLNTRKHIFNNVVKEPKTIVIISQPGLTQQIAETTLKYLESFDNFQIIYKLHPSEFAIIDNFESIKKLKDISTITFASKQDDLYYLFSRSTFVIGVYSTALIEALEFDCKIYLFNLPGVEMMKPFIQAKTMCLFDNTNSINS